MHIGSKGCNDSNLVHQLSLFLSETLKVQQLDAVLETDKQFQHIQKHLKLRLEPEADFWKQLDEFFTAVPKFGGVNAQARKQLETLVEVASRRPNTVVKSDLEDVLLGLVHVVSIAMFFPNSGRRRTPTAKTRLRESPVGGYYTPRKGGSLSMLQESIHADSNGKVESPPSSSSSSEINLDFEDNTTSSLRLILNDKVRPRFAAAGHPVIKSTSNPSLPIVIPHHSRKPGSNNIPVWTGNVEEDPSEL